MKLVEAPILSPPSEKRNELLYNFFRNTLKGQESKTSYFPYFWLMFDNLLCSLVELHYCPEKDASFQELEKNLSSSISALPKLLKPVDYGFLGIYQNEKDRHHRLQGQHMVEALQIGESTEEGLRGPQC